MATTRALEKTDPNIAGEDKASGMQPAASGSALGVDAEAGGASYPGQDIGIAASADYLESV